MLYVNLYVCIQSTCTRAQSTPNILVCTLYMYYKAAYVRYSFTASPWMKTIANHGHFSLRL